MVQAANAAPSSLHSKVPASVEVKSKLAEVELLTAGGVEVSVVSGAVVSMVHVKLAGVVSAFPAASRARTNNVWLPSDRPARASGVVHATKAAPSRLHSKVPASFEVNVKLAEVELLTAGGVEVRVVLGAMVSTVHVKLAGVASTLRAASRART